MPFPMENLEIPYGLQLPPPAPLSHRKYEAEALIREGEPGPTERFPQGD